MIATSADLLWLAKQVNTGADTFVGKTFVMTDDIDLTGINWTPIGINNKICFKGTFDGQDHTISNLSVAVEGTASAGLFANGAGATIKNLTLENVNVNGNYMTGVVMGDGSCATILNCHVNGGSVTSTPHLVGGKYDDGNHAGGIVGYLAADGGNASVTGCSVTGLVITAYRDVAGIAGTSTGSGYIPVVSDNVVSNTTIIADQTVDYVSPKAANAGEIVGRKQVEPTMSGYTVTNVIVKTLVATATQLQNALNYTIDGQNIILTDDITGDVTAAQKPNVKITIEGNNHIFAGVLLVDGKSGTYTTAGLTIKNLNFKAESISADACIRLGDGTNATRYICNVS